MNGLNCPTCGRPLVSGICERCTNQAVFRIVQRELVLLIVLCVLVVPLFVFTRKMAARNRAMNADTARTWYRDGQEQLQAGRTEAAIESFRNAATNDHDNPDYTLALATALASGNHVEEARQALMRLRTSAPENGEINLNLARLFAKDGKVSEAVRYYHNALFGLWPADQIAGQREAVRTELVRFLLAKGETGQALSELLILSSDIPDTEQAHNELGRMFLAAGDSRHALDQFNLTLRLNGKNADALSGAGQAAFNRADYTAARRYLDAAIEAGGESPEVSGVLETTNLVLSRDPLAAGIRTEERIRRLTQDLEFASGELQSCISEQRDRQGSLALLDPLGLELDRAMRTELRPRELRLEPEGIRTGLNLIRRIELAAQQVCGRSSSLQTALLLIADKHGVGEQ